MMLLWIEEYNCMDDNVAFATCNKHRHVGWVTLGFRLTMVVLVRCPDPCCESVIIEMDKYKSTRICKYKLDFFAKWGDCVSRYEEQKETHYFERWLSNGKSDLKTIKVEGGFSNGLMYIPKDDVAKTSIYKEKQR